MAVVKWRGVPLGAALLYGISILILLGSLATAIFVDSQQLTVTCPQRTIPCDPTEDQAIDQRTGLRLTIAGSGALVAAGAMFGGYRVAKRHDESAGLGADSS